MKLTERLNIEFTTRRLNVGRTVALFGDKIAARVYPSFSRSLRRYWLHRYERASCGLTMNQWGGRRFLKYEESLEMLHYLVVSIVSADPHLTLQQIRTTLWYYGFELSRSYLSRLFATWNWSWRKGEIRNINKYTPDNMFYYQHFVSWIITVPADRLKYLDESSFSSRKLNRSMMRGPRGRVLKRRQSVVHEFTYSVTLLTSMTNEVPYYISVNSGINDQWTFISFVQQSIFNGYLVEGDVLVLDNAKIHCAGESAEILSSLLKMFRIRMVMLPTYSPELNACELCFAVVKHYLKYYRGKNPFLFEIRRGFSFITHPMLMKFYKHVTLRMNE